MIPYTESIRRIVNRFRLFLGDLLERMGATPNTLTSLGLAGSFAAGVAFAFGAFRIGAVGILWAGAMDVLDGTLARKGEKVTPFGSFYDSTVDRYSDLFLFLGLIIHYYVHRRPLYMVLSALAMSGSFLVSYAKARAENFIESCSVGFWQRAERTFMLIMGSFFLRIPSVLWELAVFTHVTALHRILYARQQMLHPGTPLKKPPLIGTVLFWDYPRYCWQYDIYVALGIAVPLLIPLR